MLPAMSEVKNVLFIVNKFAGNRHQPQVEGCISLLAHGLMLNVRLNLLQAPGHATDLAREGSK